MTRFKPGKSLLKVLERLRVGLEVPVVERQADYGRAAVSFINAMSASARK